MPTGVVVILTVAAVLWGVRFFMAFRGRAVSKVEPHAGLWGYQLFYEDKAGAEAPVFVCERYGLRGKPDAIYANKNGAALIPVELKSTEIGEKSEPHRGDLMQLAAYFLLVEAQYGIRPAQGRLIYKDAAFKVKNCGKLRKALLDTMADMRDMLETGQTDFNGASFVKCKHCLCRGTVCGFTD